LSSALKSRAISDINNKVMQ